MLLPERRLSAKCRKTDRLFRERRLERHSHAAQGEGKANERRLRNSGAKVIKEVREFFILPRNHSTTARRCVLGSREMLIVAQRKMERAMVGVSLLDRRTNEWLTRRVRHFTEKLQKTKYTGI